ncbi:MULTISPECIES: hypothetical protein [unclassified Bradyrhizobium]|uniref:hypothetical protein n=1 Tax=unclassified Bradyrhizobium TaxID=2631580 RepID=UPI0028ED9AB5|nr:MULTISPECIES: hypothetical protein [unclassified Bradyrhizobium]
MSCGGCQKRQQALVRTVQAAKTGDTEAIAKELAFVATSAVQDAKAVFRDQVTAARNRLAARSPRR